MTHSIANVAQYGPWFPPFSTDRAVSENALAASKSFWQNLGIVLQSAWLMKQWSIQRERQLALKEAFYDCSQEDWDGYGAAPANELSMEWARMVLAAFPLRLGVPHIAFEPNGDAGFEWWKSPDRVLAVGVGPHGEVGYAVRLNATRATGTEMFADGLSKRLTDLANELVE